MHSKERSQTLIYCNYGMPAVDSGGISFGSSI